MVGSWMGQWFVFLESNPRALCVSACFSPGNGVGYGAGKAGFLSPQALQNQARLGISCRTGLSLAGQQFFSRPWT